MLARLGCLFIIVPVLELVLLIEMGRWVGFGPTLGLVVLTGLAGAWLARREGFRVLAELQGELGAGRLPGRALMDGAALLVGGAFLMTPGVLTDLWGMALLFPPSRAMIRRWLRGRWEAALQDGTLRVHVMGGGGPFGPGSVRGRSAELRDEPGSDADDDDRPPRPGEIVQE